MSDENSTAVIAAIEAASYPGSIASTSHTADEGSTGMGYVSDSAAVRRWVRANAVSTDAGAASTRPARAATEAPSLESQTAPSPSPRPLQAPQAMLARLQTPLPPELPALEASDSPRLPPELQAVLAAEALPADVHSQQSSQQSRLHAGSAGELPYQASEGLCLRTCTRA